MQSGGPELGGLYYLMRCTSGTWVETTSNPDTTPDAFNFIDQTDVAVSTLTASNSITITGIDTATPVAISGDGTPEFRINGGSWFTSGAITNGQTLELRLTSSAAANTMNSATVTVGTVSDQWDVTTGSGGPTGCPTIGDVCSDGSVYAGLNPDGNVPMYTTPADAGQFSWNDGSGNFAQTAIVNCSGSGAESTCNTGEANTALLAALGTSPSPAPYVAARHCDNLTAHGHSDWYLPARYELDVLYTDRTAIGGFNLSGSLPAGWYRSSSERNSNMSWLLNFSGGSQSNFFGKNDGLSVRCVRR